MHPLHHPCRWLRPLATPLLLGCLLQCTPLSRAQVAGNDAPAPTPPPRITETTEFELFNQASYTYSLGESKGSGYSNALDLKGLIPLIDPRGQILGCNGQPLADYTGFRVALYEPDRTDPTGTELGRLVPLTPTELPDIEGNGIPEGITPNRTNRNPFALTNADQGEYSFLLNRNEGQLDVGRTYILVVDVPEGARFLQRRIRVEITNISRIGDTNREQVSYRAISLDGQPIGVAGETEIDQSVVLIEDAEQIGLQLLAVQFLNTMCNADQIAIRKSGDRANAAPGDTVIYRLSIRNQSDVALDTLAVTDVLPPGFQFLANTAQAELDGQPVALTVAPAGLTLTFSTSAAIPVEGTLTIVYAAQLTPDALRGDGRNSASTSAQRVDNDLEVRDGPVVHRVRITPGLLSDCGTILGRVFEDHNFDGKQQPGEPGVPHAVIWMDDGNRITTDAEGLFSVKCVLPGYRTGALDLTALPGYTLAPNLKFIERNSPSRLVKLAPGGLVQMNFAVMPANPEEEPK